MKVIFFGGPQYTTPVLKTLINAKYEVVAIVMRLFGSDDLKNLAIKYNTPILQPESLKDDAFFDKFKQIQPDICVVAAYGKIIPKKYLDVPKYGFINIHPSLLPKYRGPSPIKTAILNGDKETGVTIMMIDEEMDHGPILAQREFSIFNFQSLEKHFGRELNAERLGTSFSKESELAKELWKSGTELLIETLPKYISKKIKPREQNHTQATLTKKFTREDGRIDWNQPAEKIYNQTRALSEEPGTWTTWNNKVLNIRRVDLAVEPLSNLGVEQLDPGTVIYVDNQIAVITGKCYLILKTIQLEGRKEMNVKDFLNGHPDFLNSKLE